MRPPLNRQIRSIISDRKNATMLVVSILKHDKKEKGEKSKSEIVISFADDEELTLEEIGSQRAM